MWILGIGNWLAFWEAGRIWKTEMLKKGYFHRNDISKTVIRKERGSLQKGI